ncbi:MAG: SDR family oxidoreductase [Balneolaceae bacterium]
MTYSESSALITGASQGIGRSIAITFAATTDRPLILLARNAVKLDETKQLCLQAGAKSVLVISCDASDSKKVEAIKIDNEFPKPGILINNAGSYLYKKVTETSNEDFRKQINVNLFTTVNIVNRFMKDLETLDRAMIINICSVGSLQGLAESGAYSAAKHAVLGYTRSLREEMKESAIGVTALNLGQTHSPSWDESEMSPEKLVNPTDVANLIVTLTQFSVRSLVEEVIIQPQHGRVAPM